MLHDRWHDASQEAGAASGTNAEREQSDRGQVGRSAAMARHFDSAHPVFRVRQSRLHWSVWVGLPLSFFAAALGLRGFGSEAAFVWFVNDERGPGENATAVFALAAAGLSVALARSRGIRSVRWLRLGFYLTAGLGVLLAGEEMSWGQHFFGWQTPEWLGTLNKQNETNVHNIADRVLDQKPRALVAGLIFVGCIVLPVLLQAGKLAWLGRARVAQWLVPEATLMPVAAMVFVPRIFDRIQVWFDVTLPHPFDIDTRYHQEMQETFIAMAIFLYLLTLFLKARAASPSVGSAR